jgi:hypothetical protein
MKSYINFFLEKKPFLWVFGLSTPTLVLIIVSENAFVIFLTRLDRLKTEK